MLFVTAPFALFLVIVLVLLRATPRSAWNPVLLGASLVFYTLWLPAYLPLLLIDIGVNYGLLQAMLRSRRPRLWLVASIAFTLALLLYFKYAAFLLETAMPLLAVGGIEAGLPEIFLPLGISFYSFQIISLAVDCERRELPPPPSLARYALYIAFFPQLIAGPILRGRELMPQLEAGARPTPERTRRGLWLLASGVGKKVLLADFLLAPFVDAVFDAPGVGNAAFHWVALYAFSFQIYFDFSGYTDMARGMALLIGFELPENFAEPYLSRSPQEFWRRWHITLSRWLRLYLFTPISRGLMRRAGAGRDAACLIVAQLVTMTLCGLWHGAGWNFVLWGALQGVLLVVWRLPGRVRDSGPLRAGDLPALLLFYHVFCLTLVVFRCEDLAGAAAYLAGLFRAGGPEGWPVLTSLAVSACFALHGLERLARERSDSLLAALARRPALAIPLAAAFGALVGAAVMAAGAGGEFIYFRF